MPFATLTPLFAQAGGGFVGGAGGGPPPPGPPPGAVATILILYAVVFGVAIVFGYVLQILYCLAMARCVREIAPRNRQLEPGAVWLALIPCVGFVFQIINDFKLVDSVKNEFEDRRWRADGDYGKIWVILYLVGVVAFGPLALVGFVMMWVKVVGYTAQFREDSPRLGYDDRRYGRYEDDDDDEDDDRPRRRRREEDDEDDRDDRDRGYRRRFD